MHQQIRAKGPNCTALGCRLKAVQHRWVGKIFCHKPAQLRRTKSLEKSRQPQAHHVCVIAADHRQPGLCLLTINVVSIQQARYGSVYCIDDFRHGHGSQMLVCSSAHMLRQPLHLRAAEHGHRHFQPHAALLKRQHLPLHVLVFDARQIARPNALDFHTAQALAA